MEPVYYIEFRIKRSKNFTLSFSWMEYYNTSKLLYRSTVRVSCVIHELWIDNNNLQPNE